MRAREPDTAGAVVDRDGVGVAWERFGTGDPALLFLCTTPIVESRMWKAQVPSFARRHTVVTVDPRGNGRSDRADDAAAHGAAQLVGDAVAVLDAAGVERAVAIGLCASGGVALMLAAAHPERVLAVVTVNPGLAVAPPHRHRAEGRFDDEPTDDVGWARENRQSWQRDWRGFTEFFFTEMLPEPHSTKQWEDCVGWSLGTTAAGVLAERDGRPPPHLDVAAAEAVCRQVRCPVLVINGDRDQCQHPQRSHRVAELTGGELVVIEGAGHFPHARDPVKVNLLLADFLRRLPR